MNIFNWFKKKKPAPDERWQYFGPDECGWVPIRPFKLGQTEVHQDVNPTHEFIPNEVLHPNVFGDVSQFHLKKGYILGTMTGSVYVDDVLVQTFTDAFVDLRQESRSVRFTMIGNEIDKKIVNRSIEEEFIPSVDQFSGTSKARCTNEGSYIRDDILILKWNDCVIDNHHVVVSYEVSE